MEATKPGDHAPGGGSIDSPASPRAKRPKTGVPAATPTFSIPLVDIDQLSEADAGAAIVGALSTSGFLLVRSQKIMPQHQQEEAIKAAASLISRPGPSHECISHPSDPKQYIMLEAIDDLRSLPEGNEAESVLRSYWQSARALKTALMHRLASGLGLEREFFDRKHRQNRETLRLLKYPVITPDSARPSTGNRCREHSDYGSVTILLQDAAGGLEVWNEAEGVWSPVPCDEPGALVVNVGSLLEKWTGGKLKATKHRVAGPASELSGTEHGLLMAAASRDRYSAAFFVDPDDDIKLEDIDVGVVGSSSPSGAPLGNPSAADLPSPSSDVAAYIRWRCGHGGVGVDYDPAEKHPAAAPDAAAAAAHDDDDIAAAPAAADAP